MRVTKIVLYSSVAALTLLGMFQAIGEITKTANVPSDKYAVFDVSNGDDLSLKIVPENDNDGNPRELGDSKIALQADDGLWQLGTKTPSEHNYKATVLRTDKIWVTIEGNFVKPDGGGGGGSHGTAVDTDFIVHVPTVDIDAANSTEETEHVSTPLVLNDDWDNGTVTVENGVETPVLDKDYTAGTVPGENDLMEITLTVNPPSLTGDAILKITAGATKIRLWPSAQKGDADDIVTGDPQTGEIVISANDRPKKLYVEGIDYGRGTLELSFTVDGKTIKDVINIDVMKVDLDVDSDNDGILAGSNEEDSMENDPPGKLLHINDDNDLGEKETNNQNAIGTPDQDWCDSWRAATDQWDNDAEDLAILKISLKGAPNNYQPGEDNFLRITYDPTANGKMRIFDPTNEAVAGNVNPNSNSYDIPISAPITDGTGLFYMVEAGGTPTSKGILLQHIVKKGDTEIVISKDIIGLTTYLLRLEPVCSESYEILGGEKRIYNPACVIKGEEAKFKVSIIKDPYNNLPYQDSEISDDLIEWEIISGSGGISFKNGVNTGRIITVKGENVEDVTLGVKISGLCASGSCENKGNGQPQIKFKVVDKTIVPVRILIVADDLDEDNVPISPCIDLVNAQKCIEAANSILNQIGIELSDNVPMAFIGNSSFKVLREDEVRSLFSWDDSNLPEGDSPKTDYLEIYFIQSFEGSFSGVDPAGLNYDKILNPDMADEIQEGIAIAIQKDGEEYDTPLMGRIVAHEVLHSCGAYDLRPNESPQLSTTEPTRKDWLPKDWNNGRPECCGYYPRYQATKVTAHYDILKRCLMSYIKYNQFMQDIPLGDIYSTFYGLNYDASGTWIGRIWKLGLAPSGPGSNSFELPKHK